MRRFRVRLSLMVVVLLGVVALHAPPMAIAQEATRAGEAMEFGGITFEPVSFAFGVDVRARLIW